MRIGIDARKLRDFGIGTYVRNLLRQLARLDGSDDYVVFCRDADIEAVRALGPLIRPVREEASNYSMREQVAIPIDVRREGIELFHAPHYVLPPLTPCRSVVTIHDCIHLRFPQYLPSRLGYAYARAQMWSATHRAARVITVSEASKRDILRYFRVAESRIDVIYNAIDDRFWQAPDPEEIDRVRQRYQLTAPFVLYAGNIKPHKNLERLIEAFHLLRQDAAFKDVQLLIIGDEVSKYANLRRDPRVCALVFDAADPYAYAEVRGTATITDDPSAELINELALKYTGQPFGTRPGEQRVIVRIAPDHVVVYEE